MSLEFTTVTSSNAGGAPVLNLALALSVYGVESSSLAETPVLDKALEILFSGEGTVGVAARSMFQRVALFPRVRKYRIPWSGDRPTITKE